jgi:hypothetical protein
MGSKKQGNLHRMFTQPDLSKIELKSKVCWGIIWYCDTSVYYKFTTVFQESNSRLIFVATFFSSSTRSSEGCRSTARSTQNSRTFIHSSNSYTVWKKSLLHCGILIRIGSYCPSIITIILPQHCSMLTKDYDLYYKDKVCRFWPGIILFIYKVQKSLFYMLKFMSKGLDFVMRYSGN